MTATLIQTDPVRDRLVRSLAEGEVLFRQGEAPGAAFLVLSGEIMLFRIAPGGRLTVVGICRPGDLAGHVDSARGQPMGCSAYAARGSLVQVVGPEYFDEHIAAAAHMPTVSPEEVDAEADGARRQDLAAAFVGSHDRRRAPRGKEWLPTRLYWRARRQLAPPRRALLLDDIEVLENRPTPWQAPALLVLLIAIVAGLVGWSAYGQLDMVVIAEGRVLPQSGQAVVAPLETGTLLAMHVRTGDVVKKGQELATLDPTFAHANLNKATQERANLQARIARLEAEIAGTAPARFSDDPDLDSLNRTLFETHRQAIAARRETSAARVAEVQAQLATTREELQAVQAQIAIYEDVEKMRSSLYRDNVGSRLQLLEARGNRAALERDAVRLARSVDQLQRQMETIRSENAVYLSERNEEAARQLAQARDELAAVTEEIAKAQRLASLVSLESPTDAVVLSVAEQVPGAVVNQGTPLVTLTPLDDTLQVEALLKPEDVANVHEGQTVRIKLDALPFQKHGTLEGRLRVVSPNIVTDRTPGTDDLPEQDRRVGYRMVIDITDATLEKVGPDFRLLPGMKAVAELNAGKRTILSYFLYPVLRVFDESLREP